MNRNPLTTDVLLALADGNIGAVSVLDKMIVTHDYSKADQAIRSLIQHKIMGPMIWVGYKDYCEEDIVLFMNKLIEKDPALYSCMINQRRCI